MCELSVSSTKWCFAMLTIDISKAAGVSANGDPLEWWKLFCNGVPVWAAFINKMFLSHLWSTASAIFNDHQEQAFQIMWKHL